MRSCGIMGTRKNREGNKKKDGAVPWVSSEAKSPTLPQAGEARI